MADQPIPVYVLSDSTGISAETMANALLLQFHDVTIERHLMPFVDTEEEVAEAIRVINQEVDAGRNPLVFSTVMDDGLREKLTALRARVIDFVGSHLPVIEEHLRIRGDHAPASLHGVGDVHRYNRRMAAVEFAIEHDDGQSLRALEKADLVLIAPSRCGKTPTSMYLAMTHGLFVANYPLIDDDFDTTDLPRPLRSMPERCFGLTTNPQRLSDVREQRRPGSRYASLQQTTWELSRAQAMYRANSIPTLDSSTRSVEEMATIILQRLQHLLT